MVKQNIKKVKIMTLQYTKADDAALSKIWFPEDSRPFTYEVRKSEYNYDLKRWDFEVYKKIEGSYALQMSFQSGLNEDECQAMLDFSIQTGDVEAYFADKKIKQRAEWDAKAAVEREAKRIASEKYWAERKALTEAMVAECDAEMARRKTKGA